MRITLLRMILGIQMTSGGLNSGFPPGRMPDYVPAKRDVFSYDFPVVMCVVLSFVLTVLTHIALWLLR